MKHVILLSLFLVACGGGGGGGPGPGPTPDNTLSIVAYDYLPQISVVLDSGIHEALNPGSYDATDKVDGIDNNYNNNQASSQTSIKIQKSSYLETVSSYTDLKLEDDISLGRNVELDLGRDLTGCTSNVISVDCSNGNLVFNTADLLGEYYFGINIGSSSYNVKGVNIYEFQEVLTSGATAVTLNLVPVASNNNIVTVAATFDSKHQTYTINAEDGYISKITDKFSVLSPEINVGGNTYVIAKSWPSTMPSLLRKNGIRWEKLRTSHVSMPYAVYSNKLYVATSDFDNGQSAVKLYRVDGDTLVQLTNFRGNGTTDNIDNLLVVGNKMYFTANTTALPSGEENLLRMNGTTIEEVQVSSVSIARTRFVGVLNNEVYFYSQNDTSKVLKINSSDVMVEVGGLDYLSRITTVNGIGYVLNTGGIKIFDGYSLRTISSTLNAGNVALHKGEIFFSIGINIYKIQEDETIARVAQLNSNISNIFNIGSKLLVKTTSKTYFMTKKL